MVLDRSLDRTLDSRQSLVDTIHSELSHHPHPHPSGGTCRLFIPRARDTDVTELWHCCGTDCCGTDLRLCCGILTVLRTTRTVLLRVQYVFPNRTVV
jgi:hypothetical protein